MRTDIRLYSDVSYYAKHGIFGWCYLIVEDNKITIGPRMGIRRSTPELLATWLEVFPVRTAMRSFPMWNMEVMSDSPHSIDGAKQVDKRDPWHLVCHYAARSVVLRKITRLNEP